jgi:hypothetical protein
MVEYQPTSRRPIAQMFRRTGDAATNLCVRLGIPPDAISYLSIVAALTAALFFWQSGRNTWLLIIAPLFCYLRLWFNMLDGMVAVAAGKASARGEIVNDLPDRISDVIIFAGVAQSDLMNPVIDASRGTLPRQRPAVLNSCRKSYADQARTRVSQKNGGYPAIRTPTSSK